MKSKMLNSERTGRDVSLANLACDEKKAVKQISWFSLDRIINSGEVIHPVLLPKYLPDIIAGRFPKEPLEIDLAATAKKWEQ